MEKVLAIPVLYCNSYLCIKAKKCIFLVEAQPRLNRPGQKALFGRGAIKGS
jgi:hypothetical protein